ncbi:hypothetical protein F5887DRAFT_945496 [Amanita rubescens]|nr:hypothetical protein F5887DRAFT_945496 [Amanita rubescens]
MSVRVACRSSRRPSNYFVAVVLFFSLTLLSSSILHAKTVLYHCARAGFSVSHTPPCHACGNEIYCLCLAICSTLITCARLCLASKLLSL